MSTSKDPTQAVLDMASVVDEDTDIATLAAELIFSLGDARQLEQKVLMLATAYAAALKVIAIHKLNTPTKEGDKK